MLGQYLRKHREGADVSLSEISVSTRIRVEYLKALESEQYDRMPGDTYVRGYIKQYLKTLSVDPAEACRLYEEHRGRFIH